MVLALVTSTCLSEICTSTAVFISAVSGTVMKTAVEVQISLKQVEVTKAKTTTIPASYGMSGTTGESGGSASTEEKKEQGFLSKCCSLLFGIFNKNK